MSSPQYLRDQARKCRAMARGASTLTVAMALKEMADTYDARARRAEQGLRPVRAEADLIAL